MWRRFATDMREKKWASKWVHSGHDWQTEQEHVRKMGRGEWRACSQEVRRSKGKRTGVGNQAGL